MSTLKILVEGPDDDAVCFHLLKQHGIEPLTIEKLEGYSKLLEGIHTRIHAQSDLEALAIVVDADLDLKSRWAELSHKIQTAGYKTCPEEPDSQGTIIMEPNKPLVGIWIMPDNTTAGLLEHFVTALIPKGDPLWPRAQQCVDQIPHEQRPFKEASLPKAKIHTWLAWQSEPGSKMGGAIARKYLDPNAPAAALFMAWIRRMLDQKQAFQSEPNILG